MCPLESISSNIRFSNTWLRNVHSIKPKNILPHTLYLSIYLMNSNDNCGLNSTQELQIKVTLSFSGRILGGDQAYCVLAVINSRKNRSRSGLGWNWLKYAFNKNIPFQASYNSFFEVKENILCYRKSPKGVKCFQFFGDN